MCAFVFCVGGGGGGGGLVQNCRLKNEMFLKEEPNVA